MSALVSLHACVAAISLAARADTPPRASAPDPSHAPARSAPSVETATPTPQRSLRNIRRYTLADAVKVALARNPSAQIAAAEIRRAHALLVQVRASAFPTLTANGVYTRLDDDRVLNGRVIAGANQLSANLTLTVPLLAPQRWARWSQAGVAEDVARASAADVRRQVASAVARAYLAIVTQRRVIEVDEHAKSTAKAHYEFAHARFEGGVGNRLDEVRARQELASVDAQLELAHTDLLRAREALGVLVGGSGPVDAADNGQFTSAPKLKQAVSASISDRADLRSLRAKLRAAHRTRKDSWTDYAPTLLGQAVPFYQNPPTLTNPLTGWQAYLILSIPLYDGGVRYGASDEREALEMEAKATLEGATRQARSEIRTAFESVKRADAALRASRLAASSAEEALDLAGTSYRAGASTNLEVIDAERRALDANTSVAIAEDEARQARLDLLIASGVFPD